MNYSNKYEYLNNEVRLPLFNVLEKYNLSKEDKDEIEKIISFIFDQYDQLSTLASFYERQYDLSADTFKKYMRFYKMTHNKSTDYSKLNQQFVYEKKGK